MNPNICRKLLVLPALLSGFAFSATAAQEAPSEEAIAFFEANCMSCHTIGGGKLTGPDLKGVNDRRNEDWLVRFILDPKGMIDSGDPEAVALFGEYRGQYMTDVPGVDKALATKLVRLIAFESAKEKSRFAGLQISDRPLNDADIERGKRLFLGLETAANGSPACVSCHAVHGIGGLGGGRLGPDLTDAYARLEGRKALAAWLGSPPSAAMQPIFKPRPLEGEEVLALIAYLKDAAESGESEAASGLLKFVLAGFGGAILLLLLFDFLWRRRYRATRRPLLERRRQGAPMGSH